MAKSNTIQIKLVSSADTGYFYVKDKNPKSKPDKLELLCTTVILETPPIFNIAAGRENFLFKIIFL